MTNTLPPQEKVNGIMINADLSLGPFYIDGMDTTPKLFRLRAQTLRTRTAHRAKTLGIWRSHSWEDYFFINSFFTANSKWRNQFLKAVIFFNS